MDNVEIQLWLFTNCPVLRQMEKSAKFWAWPLGKTLYSLKPWKKPNEAEMISSIMN